jgi:hypothetical protein
MGVGGRIWLDDPLTKSIAGKPNATTDVSSPFGKRT